MLITNWRVYFCIATSIYQIRTSNILKFIICIRHKFQNFILRKVHDGKTTELCQHYISCTVYIFYLFIRFQKLMTALVKAYTCTCKITDGLVFKIKLNILLSVDQFYPTKKLSPLTNLINHIHVSKLNFSFLFCQLGSG